MKDKFLKFDYIIFSLAILGILIFIIFYRQIFPNAGIYLHLDKSQIEKIARYTVTELGYDISKYREIVGFEQDSKQITYLMRQFGGKEAIRLMKEEIPAYYWLIKWQPPKKFKFSSNDGLVISNNPDTSISDLEVTLSTKGELLSFKTDFKQLKTDSTEKDEAFTTAKMFLKKATAEEFDKYEFQDLSIDTTYAFKWKRIEPISGEQIQIVIQIYGKQIVEFYKAFQPPKELVKKPDQTNLIKIPSVLVFLLFFISGIVILIQKLRRDEISIKSGISLSIIVGLATAIKITLSSYQAGLLEILVSILFGPLFIFLFMLMVIGVSESLGREVWSQKLTTFDALNKLKIMFPQFGQSILRGMSLAFLSLGIIVALLKLFSFVPNFYLYLEESDVTNYVLILPLLYVICSSSINSSFEEFLFRLFSISYLRKKLNSVFWIILIAAILWTFNFIGDSKAIIMPVYLHMFMNFIIGILFAFFFFRFDFMTVLIGSIVLSLVRECYPMLFWGNSFIVWNGIFMAVLLGFFVIIAFTSLYKKIDQKQLYQYVPPYVIRMQERERIKRELEIAKKVQLNFLPKQLPHLEGIDVATVCIPATEVGGDYYDFIELNDGRLGIAIGDVSGKGIQAAFYMTLTKGFLKSQAKESHSPRDVLIRLNELFYENATRETFISMIYGIFDIPRQTFTFARAGHNPIAIRSSGAKKMEILCPKGIALGLEKGRIFNQFIQEQKVSIHKNDIFVFFTDGVSEAMNNKMLEFGEERLLTVIDTNSNLFANELAKIIQQKIDEFVGNTPQHDDMTMIVVKIL